jgi:ketosteroid isomerase-like protein
MRRKNGKLQCSERGNDAMRPHPRGRAIRSLFVLLLGLSALTACRHGSDEDQVRQAIGSAAAAARDNDADGVLAQVSEDFVGNDGELDQPGLKRMLVVRAFRRDSTGVLVGPISVERQGDRLVATFTLTLAGGKPDSLLPDQADVFAMSTAWKREGGRWRCYSADWKQKF